MFETKLILVCLNWKFLREVVVIYYFQSLGSLPKSFNKHLFFKKAQT